MPPSLFGSAPRATSPVQSGGTFLKYICLQKQEKIVLYNKTIGGEI